MATFARSFIVSVVLAAAVTLILIPAQIDPASAASCPRGGWQAPPPAAPPRSPPPPRPVAPPPPPAPTPTGAGSSAGSINNLAQQRFNQIITNRVLSTVLLGVNEQVNCSDCVSGLGSAGSVS